VIRAGAPVRVQEAGYGGEGDKVQGEHEVVAGFKLGHVNPVILSIPA